MENQKIYRKAKITVHAKLVFIIHLAAYLVVNTLIVAINLTTSPEYLWCLWPLLGWGIGLFFHALITFMFFGSSSLKEQMLEKELKKKQVSSNN